MVGVIGDPLICCVSTMGHVSTLLFTNSVTSERTNLRESVREGLYSLKSLTY